MGLGDEPVGAQEPAPAPGREVADRASQQGDQATAALLIYGAAVLLVLAGVLLFS